MEKKQKEPKNPNHELCVAIAKDRDGSVASFDGAIAKAATELVDQIQDGMEQVGEYTSKNPLDFGRCRVVLMKLARLVAGKTATINMADEAIRLAADAGIRRGEAGNG